jgi:hypothetical protein
MDSEIKQMRQQKLTTVMLVIVDFKVDSPNGPPVRHRVSPERVTQELKAAGYTLVDTLEFLPRQYCLIFETGSS